MRWLGIDPGLRTTGFGVIEIEGQRLRYISSGIIESGSIDLGLPNTVTYQPDAAAIEEIFLNVNPRSTLMLGQARGAVIAAMVSTGLAVTEYSARGVKQAIVGTGRASKLQMQEMVKRLLKLNKSPSPDAADALGVAICAAHHHQVQDGRTKQ